MCGRYARRGPLHLSTFVVLEVWGALKNKYTYIIYISWSWRLYAATHTTQQPHLCVLMLCELGYGKDVCFDSVYCMRATSLKACCIWGVVVRYA